MAAPEDSVRFGVFEFESNGPQLRRKGYAVRLTHQPLRLLAILLERPGDVFTREELRQRLWEPGVFVDFDHGLNKSVKKLRDSLGDSAESPRYIETVPRVGYRFIAPVREAMMNAPVSPASELAAQSAIEKFGIVGVPLLPAEETHKPEPAATEATEATLPAPTVHRRIWWELALASVALLAIAGWFGVKRFRSPPPIQAIAVLPLENLSGDSGQDYFADGMTDELITELAHTPGLRVISRTSVMQNRGAHKSLRQIAADLGVDAIVEGSVVRAGNHVRITAQLIDTRTDKHLWAETFERQGDDILSLQDDIASRIAEGARFALSSAGAHPTKHASHVSAEAHDYFLRGRYFLEKRNARKSVESFQKAIDLQPDYAAAYAELAQGLDSEYLLGLEPRESVAPRILATARRAVQLDPDSSQAYVALGSAEMTYLWDWAAAGKDLSHAVDLEPNNSDAEHRYAIYLDAVNRPDEAVTHMRRALQLDPLSFFKNRHMASTLYYARRYDQAFQYLDRAIEMEPDLRAAVDNWRSWIYIAKGMQQDAVQYDLGVLQLDLPPAAVASLKLTYQQSGWKAYWQARSTKPIPIGDAGCLAYDKGVSSTLGADAERAFTLLNQAIDGGCYWMTTIQDDPRMDPLRSDPRYPALLKRLRLIQ